MELHQRIEICSTCTLRRFSDNGIVCGLTKEKPVFNLNCPDYEVDEKQLAKKRDTDLAMEILHSSNEISSRPTWKTVLSVIIFIIAIIRLLRFII
jgi:hypothetical protein